MIPEKSKLEELSKTTDEAIQTNDERIQQFEIELSKALSTKAALIGRKQLLIELLTE